MDAVGTMTVAPGGPDQQKDLKPKDHGSNARETTQRLQEYGCVDWFMYQQDAPGSERAAVIPSH